MSSQSDVCQNRVVQLSDLSSRRPTAIWWVSDDLLSSDAHLIAIGGLPDAPDSRPSPIRFSSAVNVIISTVRLLSVVTSEGNRSLTKLPSDTYRIASGDIWRPTDYERRASRRWLHIFPRTLHSTKILNMAPRKNRNVRGQKAKKRPPDTPQQSQVEEESSVPSPEDAETEDRPIQAPITAQPHDSPCVIGKYSWVRNIKVRKASQYVFIMNWIVILKYL